MKIKFHINYRTNWGESLYIAGNTPQLGSDSPAAAVPMTPESDDFWTLAIDLSPASTGIAYRYQVRRDDGSIRCEWGPDHTLSFDARIPRADIFDHWQDQPSNKPYFSSAFTDCICRRTHIDAPHSLAPASLMLSVDAPMVPVGATLAIVGQGDALGNWNPANAIILNNAQFPRWTVSLPIADASDLQFKFLLLDTATRSVIGWENGFNRTISIPSPESGQSVVISGLFFENPLPRWRGAGVAIPVFSLRSTESFGVGDFIDLKLMIDWARATGQKFIQILPINDTTMTGTWTDSYPYNANSTFALHPMYLRVQLLGDIADPALAEELLRTARELNGLPEVDYERATRLKNRYAREIFKTSGQADLNTPEFKDFVKRNAHWLKPYAAFCVLRDHYATADMSQWQQYAVYKPSVIDRFVKLHIDEINFIYYIQFHLDKQMRHVRDYAHANSVALKGDIPIGISRTSVDAWTSPELFNLDCSAGAPPDDFSILGQNWGFPTYNWDVMARDGYAWWKARFRKMAEYFDAYRIDHVLGFFRIWQIPLHAVHGLLGVFNPALPFTVDELRRNFGFDIDIDRHSTPLITDWILDETFHDLADMVKATYLDRIDHERYRLRQPFATQRQVVAHFATLPDDDSNRRLCDGLLSLIDNVLFIPDPYRPDTFHPRIAAQHTLAFRALDPHRQNCFNSLYNHFFYHRHNDFWREKAMAKLPPLIDATNMLVCAEDLGMIPACVPSVMNSLEILSLEIQRMPKDPAVEFADPATYPYLSVCTTSTHDMGGIRQWWEENRAATQRFFNNMLHCDGAAPFYAEPWVCRMILQQHLQSPSMLCILPLQDWMSIDPNIRRTDPREEQINVPANPRHYWRYRMHITLEQLLHSTVFNDEISSLISQSGR